MLGLAAWHSCVCYTVLTPEKDRIKGYLQELWNIGISRFYAVRS
jgi:hypothetical protein